MQKFKSDQEAFAAGQRTAREFNRNLGARAASNFSAPKFRADDDDGADDGFEDDGDEECTETLVASYPKGHVGRHDNTGKLNIYKREAKK